MRTWKIAALTAGATAVVVMAAIGVSYAIAGRPGAGRVAPHVVLAGKPVGSMTAAELSPVLTQLTNDYRDAQITVRSGGREAFRATAPEIGLSFDATQTAAHVMQVGREGSVLTKASSWLRGFVSPRSVDVAIAWNGDQLQSVVSNRDPGPRIEPIEPQLRLVDNEMHFDEGKDGRGISVRAVAEELPDAAAKGLPIVIDVDSGAIAPQFSAADLERTYDAYRDSYQPLVMVSGSKSVPLAFDTLRPWLRTRVHNNVLGFSTDTSIMDNELPGLFPDAGIPVREAHWTVDNSRPVFDLGTPGSACCQPFASTTLTNALFPAFGAQAPQVDLGLTTVAPKVPEEDPSRASITEKVATFTTYYPAGQPRVTNIHRIADLTQGAVIKPGEVFSLNDFVGPRTTEKGFVADHVIENGKFAEAVGGGISQYSTTLFNTAFFAGLDWNEYMAHTIYIDRYPYGREATISFPRPDQKIRNSTPYSVMIWPTYTNTSITIDMYSTKYVDAQQTGQTTSKAGECTRVTTERTRRYVDGRVAVDTVGALYQPREGVTC